MAPTPINNSPTLRRTPRLRKVTKFDSSMPTVAKVNVKLSIRNVWKFLGLSLVFHCVYIMSIFDIYFKSPLVVGLPPVPAAQPAPAKRLILFVGDGLRADKCFENDEMGRARAPFLRDVIAKGVGAWGISHTRVPTESRPGHVAMIAGFYEDVSAVTKGWKHNPVEFDHLLRRAKYSWSFGAPEIVQLFPGANVDMQYYAEEMIDFSRDALELDRYSFDKLRELFQVTARENPQVEQRLRGEQVYIFVHLLGLDTNGHAYRPHSREYHENVAYVDAGIKEAVRMIETFYDHDGRTAYLFTSDHGMSDAGVHGDGDPDNTRCPLIVWGAGVAPPVVREKESEPWYDISAEYTARWTMDSVHRRDVNQADLTPLMATLLGIPIPTNSEGILPIEYLASATTAEEKLRLAASLVNIKQLYTILEAKERMRAQTEPFFRPFDPPALTIKQSIERIDQLIESDDPRRWKEAQLQMTRLQTVIFAGLAYYQKYDWFILRIVISIGYISWIAYSLLYLYRKLRMKENANDDESQQGLLLVIPLAMVSLASLGYLIVKRAPVQYYFYFGFPLWFIYRFLRMASSPLEATDLIKNSDLFKNFGFAVLFAVGMELMVLCFFKRSYFALVIPVISIAANRIFSSSGAQQYMVSQNMLTAVSSLAGLFTLLDPIKEPDHRLWAAGGLAILLSIVLISRRLRGGESRLMLPRLLPTIASIAVAAIADTRFAEKQATSTPLQLIAWILVLGSFTLPFLTSKRQVSLTDRLAELFVMSVPGYIMLSVSFEPLFYTAFAVPMILLLLQIPNQPKQAPTSSSQLVVMFMSFKLLVYILLAFFGTGNFASIASFSLPSVYRLITIFSPFTMSALLIGKLFIPLIFLSAAFGALLRVQTIPAISVFLFLIATIDLMTLNFFFLVKDQGSWLEIGTSISHFVISSVFSVVTLLIYGLSELLLSGADQFHRIPEGAEVRLRTE